ncbi:putative alpha/beta hydrolase family protein [Pedobacter africanus]|uniref:Alpha/beta hydrolase family protein n=1 Tax=Pedobacter africanus TaxID=151894 RepID=A0ACC6KTI1_9SPHI|nr:hypothetical protein [Pedobacter africanus]MDR6782665.1 putative alpha/beta hydrolase family protein [Pedobacter africanus]
MKKAIFAVMALVAVAGGAAAFQNSTVEAKKTATQYTYYLENDCETPVICDTQVQGTACSIEYDGISVYDAPNCLSGHEVGIVLGNKPQ